MDQVLEQKCASCGAPLRFDPERGMLVCDNCGHQQEIPEELQVGEVALNDFDFAELSGHAVDEYAAALPICHCASCGAEIIAPETQIATTCPYCGNNVVLTDKVSGKLRPDGLIPFRIDKKQLPDALNDFYKGKALLPRDFFTEHSLGKVTGVYVPFWMFSGSVSGLLHFRGEQSFTHRSGDYVITDTRHYQLARDADVRFHDVPVDASGRISDALMDSLEPFDMADEKPFDMRYLAGFTADRFDQVKDDVAERAKRRMITSTEDAAISTLRGYAGIIRAGGSLTARLSARYLLLPVYLFSLEYGGKSYAFAMNGQSGKVVGELPVSGSRSWKYFLLRAGITAAVIAAGFVAKYLLGV